MGCMKDRGVGSLKEPTQMRRRKWSCSEKLQIVLEGIEAAVPLAELCTRHRIP